MLTRDEFNAILAKQGTLIIDGALATELEARGHDLNHPLWSAKVLKDSPESIKKVHLDYYLAGADIAITSSYQASNEGLYNHFGMSDSEASELIVKSAKLALQARYEAYKDGIVADRKLLVAGSVGPYGAFLADGSEYSGDYTRTQTELQSFHRPRIQALIKGGVDLLAIETMPNIHEILAVLEMLREEFPDAICWLSCTLKDTQHISDGTHIDELLGIFDRFRDNIVGIGINCVPANIAFDALQQMSQISKLPLVCYPNSGESWDAGTNTWSGDRPECNDLNKQIQNWQTQGAKLIGGCCRTGPQYIERIAGAIRAK